MYIMIKGRWNVWPRQWEGLFKATAADEIKEVKKEKGKKPEQGTLW